MLFPFEEFNRRNLVSDFAIKTITEFKKSYESLTESELSSLATEYNSTSSAPGSVAIAAYVSMLG